MQAISSVINKGRDAYLKAIDWVVAAGEWIKQHPHKAGWGAVGFFIVNTAAHLAL